MVDKYTEKTEVVYPVRITIECGNCGDCEGLTSQGGFMTNPPKWKYHCSWCDHTFFAFYPPERIEYRTAK